MFEKRSKTKFFAHYYILLKKIKYCILPKKKKEEYGERHIHVFVYCKKDTNSYPHGICVYN